jgi:hypothetical protein
MDARSLLPALLLTLAASAGAVEMTGDTPPDGLRGLLEAPTLFGSGPCTQRAGGKYTLRAAPDPNSAPAGILEAEPIAAGQRDCSQDALAPRLRKTGDAWSSPVPIRDFKPGHPGLVVTDARGIWVRIMLGDGEAWLSQPPGSSVRDYGGMLVMSPVHTLRGWDGRVCDSPRLGDCRKMAMPSNPAVRITRVQMFGEETWFKVEFGIGACEGATVTGRDVLSGWIPGFGPTGANGKRPLTLWMDPHGC